MEQRNLLYMKVWLKKYWWITVVILILPIIINFILLIPAISPIIGDNAAWLSFWGGYIGAIISTGTAFLILNIQRKDNKKENEDNRKNNETQNENNRNLQLNIMSYQKQSNWIDRFSLYCLEYCHTFNYNDTVLVTNIMWREPKEALNIIKTLYDRLSTTEAKFSFLNKIDERGNMLKFEILKTHQLYQLILDDIQWVVLYFIHEAPPIRTIQNFNNFLGYKNANLSNAMNEIIRNNNAQINNWENYFHHICFTRAKDGKEYESTARDKMYMYIKEEQKQIDNILVANLK